jgi:phospholipid N-methyltransferase
MQHLTATYSPDDNKLRLYSTARLEEGLYRRVHDAGFRFAPKQDLFVAPSWTPAREDLLIELCGEIDDDDTSLVERAEERADRFDGYSERRAADAKAAHAVVTSITEHIPLGQPILVGHHSEARARRDAERIDNAMRKAVSMWDTHEYWERRAAGALRHAKYKERADVRHRRIKRIEADRRKCTRSLDLLKAAADALRSPTLTAERALMVASASSLHGLWSAINADPDNFRATCDQHLEREGRNRAHWERWIAHYDCRLNYERAMLAEQGGIKADGFDIVPGGQVLVRGEWFVVKRVNRSAGAICSVTTNARFVPVRGIEEIKDYRAPLAEVAATVKAASKLPPLCNYPGTGFHAMTKAEWDATHRDYKGSRELGAGAVRPGGYRPDIKAAADVASAVGRHRVRSVVHRGALVAVYLTDVKRVDPPAISPAGSADELAAPDLTAAASVDRPSEPATIPTNGSTTEHAAAGDDGAQFNAMREQLKHGVQVVSASQLFPTPVSLAVRMVELAAIEPGHTVLEPSAGTGRILRAIREATGGAAVRTAVEISARLCDHLRVCEAGADVVNTDFLTFVAPAAFDRIVMNPPFSHGDDIRHIRHALEMLKPGGRLVAVCANGPRQREALYPLVAAHGGEWVDLPADTFAESGTSVNAALMILTA